MAGLEATLVIGAKNNTGATLAALQKTIGALEKQVEAIDKLSSAAGKAARANDPLAASISAVQKSLAEQRAALTEASAGLERLDGAGSGAAYAQARLRSQIERTTGVLTAQGAEASRVAARVTAAQKHGAGGGRFGAIGDTLPFAGPRILSETGKAAMAGATVQETIAALVAAGDTADDIAKARADFRDFSKTHAGVLESDYLTGYKDARVIAPGEKFDMAKLGATYRVALRNSGMSTSDSDVGNVMRIMDELGLKSMGEREGFLDNFTKVQQAFGSQISTETALSSYRNAKQSVYDWSPEFRDRLFPTLLQSAGQQGGTEMMTALNNYIGGHMQASELKALIGAGFANNKDLTWDHNHPVLRPGAKLFEADLFKSNIAQWAWDFHSHFMGRKGATEGKFDDLIAKMPRNMAALIAFMTHNDARIHRDSDTIGLPMGLKAAGDKSLANNPVAGLDALGASIKQFSADVSSPAMGAVGANLSKTAQGIQSLAAAYSDFSRKSPEAAKALGVGGLGAGAAAGGWLSWKLMSGVGRFFGFGGEAAGGGTASAIGGVGTLGIGGAATIGAGVIGATASLYGLLEAIGPDGPLSKYYTSGTGFISEGDLERSRRSRLVWHGSSFVDDPEAAHARAMATLMQRGPDAPLKVSLDPTSKAEVVINVRVEPTDGLFKMIAAATTHAMGNISASVGRMDTDAAPPQRWGGPR